MLSGYTTGPRMCGNTTGSLRTQCACLLLFLTNTPRINKKRITELATHFSQRSLKSTGAIGTPPEVSKATKDTAPTDRGVQLGFGSEGTENTNGARDDHGCGLSGAQATAQEVKRWFSSAPPKGAWVLVG
jgi:hypothetical protein